MNKKIVKYAVNALLLVVIMAVGFCIGSAVANRNNGSGADNCVGCGACEAACPQHLEIIDGLARAWKDLKVD